MSEARPEPIGDPRPESGTHQHRNGEMESGRASLTRSHEAQSLDSLDTREPRSKLLGKWHRNAH